MKLKVKMKALETQAKPQRWAAHLRSIEDGDELRMDYLLAMCDNGPLLPMPAEIQTHFKQRVDLWRNGPEKEYEVEQIEISDVQHMVVQSGVFWRAFHDVAPEFRTPGALEMVADAIGGWLEEAVPGAIDLSDAALMRLGAMIAGRLDSEPNEDIDGRCVVTLNDCLGFVRDAVATLKVEA